MGSGAGDYGPDGAVDASDFENGAFADGLGAVFGGVYSSLELDVAIPGFIEAAVLGIVGEPDIAGESDGDHAGVLVEDAAEHPRVTGSGRRRGLCGGEDGDCVRKRKERDTPSPFHGEKFSGLVVGFAVWPNRRSRKNPRHRPLRVGP